MERRTFIIGAIAGGIGLLEYTTVSRWMNGMRQGSIPSVRDFERDGSRAALLAITPNEDFYVTSKGSTPRVDAHRWQLRIDGLVENPVTLNYEALQKLPRVDKFLTLECISNPIGGSALGNAKWTGTALKPLLERARPGKDAAHAIFYAADGFSSGHPIARAMNDENFLAYKMNGEDLPPDHGYPLRVFIPGKFGMKQPKWVTRIQLVNSAYLGYWESRGWSDTCERRAHARFSGLQDGAKISGKNFELTGYALGNLDGIKAVEISFDDGQTWKPASIFSNPSPLTWCFWKYMWVGPQPGTYHLRVRAVDGQGRVEGWDPRGIYPDGATGQQALKVVVG